MNTNLKAWSARIGETVLLGELLFQKIGEKTVGMVSPDLRLTVESIPFKIEEARTRRLNQATVQDLHLEVDYKVPATEYPGNRPQREWLCTNAAFVFHYCHAAGLHVKLTAYPEPRLEHARSSIVVEWPHLVVPPSAATVEKSSLVQVMRDVRVDYPVRSEADIRLRVAEVLQYAPAILAEIQGAIENRKSEVKIFGEPRSVSSKSRTALFDDVVTLCELLGVETQEIPRTTYKSIVAYGLRQFWVR